MYIAWIFFYLRPNFDEIRKHSLNTLKNTIKTAQSLWILENYEMAYIYKTNLPHFIKKDYEHVDSKIWEQFNDTNPITYWDSKINMMICKIQQILSALNIRVLYHGGGHVLASPL